MPASFIPECCCNWVTRVLASCSMSSLVPKWRHPVGHDLMQAGSSPCPTESDKDWSQPALIDFLGGGMELGNIKRTAGDAELAADAVGLFEIDNAVAVLHDGAVSRA